MGQSWSKPTITQVYWKGQLKRVMIVGGGYDARYENLAYSHQAGEKVRVCICLMPKMGSFYGGRVPMQQVAYRSMQ